MKTRIFHNKQSSIHGAIIKLLLVIALMSSQLCYGQDYVYINTSDTCIGTITRYERNNQVMHYLKTGDRSGKFLFLWGGYTSQYKAYPLYGYDVTDFTVVGDTLFFCGNDPDSIGFYGWANIGAHPLVCQFNIYSLSSNDKYITDVRRIRVFYNHRFPTILLIGNYIDTENQRNVPAVVHVKDFMDCEVAYCGEESFDDIVVLDNHVVTIARKGYGNPSHAPHLMRVLKKNGFYLGDPLFDTLYTWAQRVSDDYILAQYIGLNSFVSVYHQDTTLCLNTYGVNNNGILNIFRYHTMNASINEPIRDVSYNDFDSTLMVIHKYDTMVIASLFKRNVMPHPYFSWLWSSYPDMRHFCTGCNTSLMSTSKISHSKYMVSGAVQDKMVVWKTDTPCKIDLRFQM